MMYEALASELHNLKVERDLLALPARLGGICLTNPLNLLTDNLPASNQRHPATADNLPSSPQRKAACCQSSQLQT